MKIDLIKWDKVKPGSRVDLNFINYQTIPTYFIKYDHDLNNFTVYNPLSGQIENHYLTIKDHQIDNIDDRECEFEFYNPDVNDIIVFNEAIKNTEYELNPEKFAKIKYLDPEKFFKIKNWNNETKTCTLISIKNKFILRNIHWSDISPIYSIFNLDNLITTDEINNLTFNSVSSQFSNYHLYIRNDKYRKFIIVVVFDVITREYGINLIDTTIYQDEESYDFKNYIESEITNCFEQILKKYHPIPMPQKREVYFRVDLKNDESLVQMKFKFKSWTCLYDLVFDNIFPNKVLDIEKKIGIDRQKRIESVEKDLKNFDAFCQKKIKGQNI